MNTSDPLRSKGHHKGTGDVGPTLSCCTTRCVDGVQNDTGLNESTGIILRHPCSGVVCR